jgi:hypothetical protein
MNLLVLPPNHTAEDQGIWRAAIQRGWKTIRFNDKDDPELLKGYDMVRYYGNVLHKSRIEKFLPIKFKEVSQTLLADLDISWTGRKIKRIPFGDLETPLKEDTFIKCVDIKWLEARVYRKDEKPSSQWQGMQDKDLIYVQEPIVFVDEVRCFVKGRDVLTMSMYKKNKVFYTENIPVNLETAMSGMCCSHSYWLTEPEFMKLNLPEGVVLDYGCTEYGIWYFIEANEAWGSGLYDCDPNKAFDAIIASQENL